MFEKIKISNFRCFEDFSVDFSDQNSCIILGSNGTGKSTIATVIEIFQKIANQTTRAKDLLQKNDFHLKGNNFADFEITVKLNGKIFCYSICFELPENFYELRVSKESLYVDGELIFKRELAQVTLSRSKKSNKVIFSIDWHLVALPIIQTAHPDDPISRFIKWLSQIIILRPIPPLMKGISEFQAFGPKPTVENFGEWFTGMMTNYPEGYAYFIDFLRSVMPDIASVRQQNIGDHTRTMTLDFMSGNNKINIPFSNLSDGEKCFFIAAMLIATVKSHKNIFCFWDEPENHLAPQEVSSTIMAVRKVFNNKNQLLMTSHNEDVIRRFPYEKIIVFSRKSHLSAPFVKDMESLDKENTFGGDTINLWLKGDLES